MTERERTIKGLECCIKSDDEACPKECPFYKERLIDDLPYMPVIRAALKLLKEQEPVLLKNQHKPGGHFINANSPWISRCPNCGKKVESKQTRYCKYCGQAVKWDD